ncbi:MAG: undecaprenyl-diphosphatase UppP [Thermoanaerobaculia bacterium]
MSLLQAIVLGLVQGLTEFIPVSSTAHLLIVPQLLGWGDPGAPASAVIQFGTVIAAIIYFARDILRIAAGFFRGLFSRRFMQDPDFADAVYVIIGTIPIVVLGILLKKTIETTFRSTWIVTFMIIFIAIVLQLSERYATRRGFRNESEFNAKDAAAMGIGQCLALIPGASRSGSTLMTAFFRRIPREKAARFSFIMSLPAIAGAGFLELFSEKQHLAELGKVPIVVAIVVAFITGWASIWFLLRYLRTHSTYVFIYYRYALGALMVLLLATGYLKA